MNLNQVTLPVTDMASATRFYQQLGFTLIVDTPHYARFECPVGDTTFSLSLAEHVVDSGAVVYFEHPQLDAWVKELKASGLEFEQDPTDQSWLWREAIIRDPSGNKLKLYRAGDNRRYPPWRVGQGG